MKHRYIKDYRTFKLNEQDFGLDTAIGGETPPSPKKQKEYSFIFLNDGKKVSTVGPLQKEYNLYRIKEDGLNQWLDKSINKKREDLQDASISKIDKIKNDLRNVITGERFSISKIDNVYLNKFKNDVKAGLIDGTDSVQHYKDKYNKNAFNSLETITVEFDSNNMPLTTNLEVTFIDAEK